MSAEPLGNGNINDTYLVQNETRRFVLQRLSSSVFPRPAEVAENFVTVTSHVRCRQEAGPLLIQCPESICTLSGTPYWLDTVDEVWRAQIYLEHYPLRTSLKESSQARQLGRVLARFHFLTADLDTKILFDPLPGFHSTPRYLQDFDRVWAAFSGQNTAELRYCVTSIEKYRPLVGVLEEAGRKGRIRWKTIHGDPKVDNFICDRRAQVVGLLDLDTVGPGPLLYDLGDCLRSCCNRVGEQTENPQTARFDIDICKDILAGYIGDLEGTLTLQERGYIYEAVLLISFELGLRFLTDHLLGDVYFKVRQAGENLQRALVQFHLTASIAGQERGLRSLAAGC